MKYGCKISFQISFHFWPSYKVDPADLEKYVVGPISDIINFFLGRAERHTVERY